MNNTKFALREKMAATFELALRNAGMQRWTGTDPFKTKYWRGQVKDTSPDRFVLYTVTDNLEISAADNKSFIREVYINGTFFTRTGFSSGEFQDECEAMETECELLNIMLTFGGEDIDTSIDQDSPISYCNFEAKMRLSV